MSSKCSSFSIFHNGLIDLLLNRGSSTLLHACHQVLLFEDDKFIGDGHIGDIFNLAEPKSVNLGDNSMQWNVCPF